MVMVVMIMMVMMLMVMTAVMIVIYKTSFLHPTTKALKITI